MKAMNILVRCRYAEVDERRIQQQITRRREAMKECASPPLDGPGGSGTASRDKMASMLASIEELEQELRQRQKERRAEVYAACALLDTLPEQEGNVLHKYYLLQHKLDAIARDMYRAPGYIRSLKRTGEKLLGNVPDDVVDALLPEWYVKK